MEVKSYRLWTYEYTESFGFVREDRSRFKVTFVCRIILSYSESGNLVRAPAKHDLKWTLHVYMALSACLPCLNRVTNWHVIDSSSNTSAFKI